MKDENGNDVSEKDTIKAALDHLAEACCFAFETETDTGHAFAFMIDSAIKYGQCILRDDDVLSASADYTAYENDIYLRKRKHLEIIK